MNKKLIIASTILLTIFGIIMIYSASYIVAEYKYNNPYKFVLNQSIFAIIGFILMYIFSKINYNLYYDNSNKIILTCIVLLILVLIPGVGSVRNGSRSWFGIGGFGIQPSEFAKLGLIIFVSKYLYKNKRNIKDIKKTIIPILLVIMFIFGLIMLQPDFGTGTIIVMSVIGLLFISGVSLKFFLSLGITGVLGVVFLVLIAPYRLSRILSFVNPWLDPLGSGFQIIQSLYAIGPGGLLGFGFLNSRQKHFYLPEPQTDFIFSIISEEFGFMGVLIVSLLFLTLIISCIRVSLKCKDLFAKYLSFGIIFQLSFQTILNLCVVTGIIPVTGFILHNYLVI